MASSESTPLEPADSAAGTRRGKGAVLLLVILCGRCGGSGGVSSKGFTRPLLDLVTRVGVAPLGGSLLVVFRLPTCALLLAPLLQVCLRAEERGGAAAPPGCVGGREIECDL